MKIFIMLLLLSVFQVAFAQEGSPIIYNMFGTTVYNQTDVDTLYGDGTSDTLTTRTVSWSSRDTRRMQGTATLSGYIKKLAGTNRNIKVEAALRGSTGIVADWFELSTKTAADSIPYVIPVSANSSYGYSYGIAFRYISVSGASADTFLVQSVYDIK